MKGGSSQILSYVIILVGVLVFGALIALAVKYNKNKRILNNNSKNKNDNTNKNDNEEKVRAPTDNISS